MSTVRWHAFVALLQASKPIGSWVAVSAGLFATPFVVSCVFAFQSTIRDDLHWAGFLFQIAAIATIVRDLNSTIRGLGGASIWSPARDWWILFVRMIRGNVTISGAAAMAFAGATASARATLIHANVQGSVEERLSNLEERMRLQEAESGKLYAAIDTASGHLQEQISQERDARQSGEKRLLTQITQAMAGSLRLKLGGFAYACVGALISLVSS